MELHALTQLEGPDRAVGIRRPAYRKQGLRRQVGSRKDEVLGHLRQYGDATAIGDLHRVDRARRNDLADPDRPPGRRAGARGQQKLEAGGTGRRRKERQGETQDRTVTHEIAPADPAIDEPVDQVVLNLASPAAQPVDKPMILGH